MSRDPLLEIIERAVAAAEARLGAPGRPTLLAALPDRDLLDLRARGMSNRRIAVYLWEKRRVRVSEAWVRRRLAAISARST